MRICKVDLWCGLVKWMTSYDITQTGIVANMTCFWFDVGNLVEIICPRSCWIFTQLTLPRIDFQPASYWYSCYSFIHPHVFPSSFVWNQPSPGVQSIDATGRTLTALVLASERCGRKSRGNFRREGFRMCGWAVSTSHFSGEVQGTPWWNPILKRIYNYTVYTWFRIFTFEIIWTIIMWVEL